MRGHRTRSAVPSRCVAHRGAGPFDCRSGRYSDQIGGQVSGGRGQRDGRWEEPDVGADNATVGGRNPTTARTTRRSVCGTRRRAVGRGCRRAGHRAVTGPSSLWAYARQDSGVGALAVVGGAALAGPALATALAHGDLPDLSSRPPADGRFSPPIVPQIGGPTQRAPLVAIPGCPELDLPVWLPRAAPRTGRSPGTSDRPAAPPTGRGPWRLAPGAARGTSSRRGPWRVRAGAARDASDLVRPVASEGALSRRCGCR